MSQVTLPDVPVGSTGWGGTVNGYWSQIQAALRVPHCNVAQDNAQSIPGATITVVDWNVVVSDPLSMFNASNDRVTVPTAGVYLFDAAVAFTPLGASKACNIWVRKNVSGTMTLWRGGFGIVSGASGNYGCKISCAFACAAGDEFDVIVSNDESVSRSLFNLAAANYFDVTRLSVL